MGEKVVTKSEGEKNTAAEGVEKAAAGGGAAAMTVVLKLDLHCEGCAKKVRRSVTNLEGVETVKSDCDAKKLTVTGNVDPVWLREKVETKTKKKVELISPQPKKDGGSGGAATPTAGADKKVEEKKGEENKVDDSNKSKVAAVSTMTMKTKLHCDGCAHKIRRIIIKNFDGVDSLTTNLQKDLITVIGTMDVKDLVTVLKEKLKRGVEIVPPTKDDGAGETKAKEGAAVDGKEKPSGGGGSGDKGQEKKGKESDGEGGAKQKEGGGNKKEVESKSESGTGGSIKGGAAAAVEETKVEMSKMEYHSSYNPQTHYAMTMQMHNQNYGHPYYGMHHHQSHTNTGYHVAGPPMPPPTYLDTHTNDSMFSDENPNGCYIM